MKTDYQKIMVDLEFLLKRYSNEKWATVNPFRLVEKGYLTPLSDLIYFWRVFLRNYLYV